MASAPSVIGRYQVRERLGQGGMGALFLALDPAIDRLVALKLLRVDSEEMRARFLREARSAGRLQHPHIVTIYDVGEHDGQPFIAMEYIKGETLAELVQRRAPLTLARKLTLMEDLCEGLEYAHAAGLVHRDIKPANLMITNESGVLKILDFGIARGSGDSGLTEVGTMMGTPNYMSPEQASGQTVDHRSDIFSVGSVIYEMLVYRQAFPGKDWQVVLPSILEKSPVPLTTVDRGLSPRLDAIVGRSMSREPADRYQDLRTLGQELAEFRRQLEDAQLETVQPTPTPLPARSQKRPATDQARLAALRKKKLSRHMTTAEEALGRGDIEAARAAAEDASLLDSEGTQVLQLLTQVEDAEALKQFEQHLKTASAKLDEQSLTLALQAVDQALELKPTAPAARELRQKVAEAIEQRDRQRQRAQLIDRALHTARDALVAGTPKAAIRAVSEVLAYAPGHEEASALKQQALEAVEERRRSEALEREARQAVETARREFDAGDHTAAIQRLEPLEATHPMVAETLASLREQAAAVKLQIETGADELNPEQIAARRQQEADGFVERARQQQASQDYPRALALIDAALAVCEDHEAATALRIEIEEQRAAEEARREAEAAERRQQRQQELTAQLDQVDDALSHDAPEDALRRLDQIIADDATTLQAQRLQTLRRTAEAKRQAALEQAEREASDRVSQALELAAEDHYTEAVALLEKLERPNALVTQTLEHLRKEQTAVTRARRRDATRKVVLGRLSSVTSAARRAAANRRVALGGGAVLVVVAGLSFWLARPPASPSSPTTTAQTAAVSIPSRETPPRRQTPTTPAPPLAPTAAEAEAAVAEAESTTGLSATPDNTGVPGTVDPTTAAVTAILAVADDGDYVRALADLDALDPGDERVVRARAQVEQVWNAAAQDVADRSRQLAAAGSFGQALTLLDSFAPPHGFVDAARDDVTRDLDADADAVSRQALEMAAGGDHQGAVELLRAYEPAHARILGTIDELLANPDCPDELDGVPGRLGVTHDGRGRGQTGRARAGLRRAISHRDSERAAAVRGRVRPGQRGGVRTGVLRGRLRMERPAAAEVPADPNC